MPDDRPASPARGNADDPFAALVLRYLDGTLDDAGVESLERELRADPARRDAFVRLCVAESALHEELAGESADLRADEEPVFAPWPATEAADDPALAPPPPPLRLTSGAPRQPTPRHRVSRRARVAWVPWAAVLVLATGAALFVLRGDGPKRPGPPIAAGGRSGTVPAGQPAVVATVVRQNDARWDGVALSDGAGVEAGRVLTLAGGCVELRFAGGATAVLEGPCQFTVSSPTAASLASGRMAATVAGGGFVVETPTAQVTDLGTEFGVAVDSAGTRVDVFAGTVAIRPPAAAGRPAAEPLVVAQGQAATASGGNVLADPGGAVPQRFVRSLGGPAGPRSLDVVDLIGGGDGTTGRRDVAVDVATGAVGERLPQPGDHAGDGGYRRVSARPVVDGCFVPDGSRGPVAVSSAGHAFAFPGTSNTTHYTIWAGGHTAKTGSAPGVHFALGGTDYGAAGHTAVVLHSNKGLTIDLSAVRRLHPGRPVVRFRCVAGNSHPLAANVLADAYVLVDGQPRFERRWFTGRDGAFAVDVPLHPTDGFLTLAVTDGGDGIARDWVLWADPVIEVGGRP